MMTTETNDNSGGTGYCAGNDFTIKPLTTTVDIKLVRRLMATWHTNGLTDSNIRKILLLYLGEPAWMDLNKVYPCGNFYNIAKSFHFNCKTSFLKTLMSCKEFGYIWKDKRKVHDATNLLAFYTPIWHKEDKEDMMSEDGSNLSDNSRTTEDSTQNTENSARYNSLYDNIIKKNIKKKENNYYSSAPKIQNFSPEQKKRINAAALTLINYIATDQFEGENGTHTEYVEGLISTDMHICAQDLGMYFTDCVG